MLGNSMLIVDDTVCEKGCFNALSNATHKSMYVRGCSLRKPTSHRNARQTRAGRYTESVADNHHLAQ